MSFGGWVRSFFLKKDDWRNTPGQTRFLPDLSRIANLFDRSPVPGIFMLILVLVTSSVILTLAARLPQGDMLDLKPGQIAPRSVVAKFDFQYADTASTEKKRKEAEQASPLYFRIDPGNSLKITARFEDFFKQLEQRQTAEQVQKKFTSNGTLQSAMVAHLRPELLSLLCAFLHHPTAIQTFQDELSTLLAKGILDLKEKSIHQLGQSICIIDSSNRRTLKLKKIAEQEDPQSAANALALNTLKNYSRNEGNASLHTQLAMIFLKLIGQEGNLKKDNLSTENSKNLAIQSVKPVMLTMKRGELLMERGKEISPEQAGMLNAYQEQLKKKYESKSVSMELQIFLRNFFWCLIFVTFGGFYLYHLHRDIVRSSTRTSILALVIILSILLNFLSLQFFYFLIGSTKDLSYQLLPNALPVGLTAALLSVMLGFRVSLCAGFFVSSVAAMMSQEQAFSFALRGMVICAMAALAVRSATNYRSYFMRIILSVFPLCWVLNLSGISMQPEEALKLIAQSAMLALGNALLTAICALVLTFFFELVFNVSTNMALMVLCDYNHPLLERLKREAPGTFFHSLMVATLVEDAARAVGANPLRAKAGALFHDIGKLSMPQYFTENNINLPNQHLELSPQMSAIIIRDHVKEGLILADQYHLCRTIRDAISQHHGNDLVGYFYAKALENEKNNPDPSSASPVMESQFRYQGTPPQDKEMAIISLADACEAATRSLDKPSAARIAELVDQIFLNRFKGGQLRCSSLTLAELQKVRDSFVNTLVSMKHGRIAYQKGLDDNDSSEPDPEHAETPRA